MINFVILYTKDALKKGKKINSLQLKNTSWSKNLNQQKIFEYLYYTL